MSRIALKNNPLDGQTLRKLAQRSVGADDIFSHLDDLNEEMEETIGEPLLAEASKVLNVNEGSRAQQVVDVGKNVTEWPSALITDLDIGRVAATPTKSIETKPLVREQQMQGDFLAEEERKANAALAARRAAEERAAAAAPQKAPEPQLSPEEQRKKALADMLAKIPGAPNEKKIAAFKQQHGANNVHVLALGDDDVYFFTQLTRGPWKKIQSTVQKTVAADPNKDPDDYMRELVLRSCTLWPELSVEFFYTSKAGVIDTLYEMIMLHSGFLSPQQAMMLTTQL